jgi:carbon monoxide dehydrogenase subunit G
VQHIPVKRLNAVRHCPAAGGLASAGKKRGDELNAPDGATFVKLAFFLDESGSVTTKDPDVNVRGFLAQDGGNDPGDAAERNLDAVVRCFVANAADGEKVFALRCHDEMDQARFGGSGRHHGETGGRTFGVEVQQQGKGKTVADVGFEIKVVLGGFSVLVANGDLPGGRVDQHIERFGKRGSTLDVVVTDKLEDFALRKDRDVIVEGTVAKVKNEARRDPIPMGNLNKIAAGDAVAPQRLEHQESMERSLAAAHGNGVSVKRSDC